MNIGTYTYEEFVHLVKSFHGSLAPGLLIGGFMVDMAMRNLPEGEFFDAICETPSCLPDAVQLLTPCTIGNGWLKVFDFGRFAVVLYDKESGRGIRVFFDLKKLERWPEVKSWFFKLKPKKEQDSVLLMAEIKKAGHDLLSLQPVRVDPKQLQRGKMGKVAICPVCNEAYPARDGSRCRACQGESPYL